MFHIGGMGNSCSSVIQGVSGGSICQTTCNGQTVVTINGRTVYDSAASAASSSASASRAKNLELRVDGEVIHTEALGGRPFRISVQADSVGDIRSSVGDFDVTASKVGSLTTSQGNVRVEGSVDGDVGTTNGCVEVIGNVGGGVRTTNGSVAVGGGIDGDVSTVCGSVKRKKRS